MCACVYVYDTVNVCKLLHHFQSPVPIDAFLYPVETDPVQVELYMAAIASGNVRCGVCVCVCVCVCVRACPCVQEFTLCVCVRACPCVQEFTLCVCVRVCACVRVRVCVRAHVYKSLLCVCVCECTLSLQASMVPSPLSYCDSSCPLMCVCFEQWSQLECMCLQHMH